MGTENSRKMKYYSIIILLFMGLISNGQDTAKNLSKSSISFTAGINVTCPTVSDLLPGGSWGIQPTVSIQPWCSLSYNCLFHETSRSFTGLNFMVGYAMYKYAGATGQLRSDIPVFQQINVGEIAAGIFINKKLKKDKREWHNEIDVLCSFQTQTYSASGGEIIPSYYQQIDVVNKDIINFYIFYQTGKIFWLNKNITLMPLLALPLLNITSVVEQHFIDQYKPYYSLRAGITFTYNFNKT